MSGTSKSQCRHCGSYNTIRTGPDAQPVLRRCCNAGRDEDKDRTALALVTGNRKERARSMAHRFGPLRTEVLHARVYVRLFQELDDTGVKSDRDAALARVIERTSLRMKAALDTLTKELGKELEHAGVMVDVLHGADSPRVESGDPERLGAAELDCMQRLNAATGANSARPYSYGSAKNTARLTEAMKRAHKETFPRCALCGEWGHDAHGTTPYPADASGHNTVLHGTCANRITEAVKRALVSGRPFEPFAVYGQQDFRCACGSDGSNAKVGLLYIFPTEGIFHKDCYAAHHAINGAGLPRIGSVPKSVSYEPIGPVGAPVMVTVDTVPGETYDARSWLEARGAELAGVQLVDCEHCNVRLYPFEVEYHAASCKGRQTARSASSPFNGLPRAKQ